MRKTIKKLKMVLLIIVTLALSATPILNYANELTEVELARGIGTASNPAQAAITKHLEMPIQTTLLAEKTFTFEFESIPSLSNLLIVGGSPVAMPTISSQNVNFNYMTPTAGLAEPREDVVRGTVTTGDVLANVVWPGTGVYVYRVSERSDTFTNTPTEQIYFDLTNYLLYVVVEEDANGQLFVSGTHGWLEGPTPGQPTGPKLDPDPGRPGSTRDSDLQFTNLFVRRSEEIAPPGPIEPLDPTPEIPVGTINSALIVTTRIAGNLASPNTIFNYTGTISNSSLVDSRPGTNYDSYTGFLYELNEAGDSYVLVTNQNNTPISHTITAGTMINYQLRHNQALIFNRVPIGNSFTRTQNDSGAYIPRIDLTTNGTLQGNHGLNSGGVVSTADVLPGTTHRIGQAANIVAFTNTRSSIPITGIIMNNLPIILAAVAALGIIAMAFINKKRRKNA